LLKIIKLLNLTETAGTYLVRGPGLMIFERAYRDFPGIAVGQYAPAPYYQFHTSMLLKFYAKLFLTDEKKRRPVFV
jgi:predicted RecB family nuclease